MVTIRVTPEGIESMNDRMAEIKAEQLRMKERSRQLAEEVRAKRAADRKERMLYGPTVRNKTRALRAKREAKRLEKIASLERINTATQVKRAAFDLLYARHVLEVRLVDGVKRLYWTKDRSSKARAGEQAGCRGQIKVWDYNYPIGDVIAVIETGEWPDNLRNVPPPYTPAKRTAWNKGIGQRGPRKVKGGET